MSDATQSIASRAAAVRATGRFSPEAVPSPCISVCSVDAATGLCAGCLRTLDEIAAWGRLQGDGKRAVWALIEARATALGK